MGCQGRGLLLSRQKRERPVFNNCGSVNSRGLLQPESTEEREARFQQLLVCRQQRIAEESTDRREACLHRLRVNPEETEARRAHDRHNHMPMDTAEVPLSSATCSFKYGSVPLSLANPEMYHMPTEISWYYCFSPIISLYIPLQLHSIRMHQILPFAHARPTMPCILLVNIFLCSLAIIFFRVTV